MITDNVIGIEFTDPQSDWSIRKTEAIIEDKIYAPIIKARGKHIDRDFDGDCIFSFKYIQSIIDTRKALGK